MKALRREAEEAGLSVNDAVTEAVERGWGGFRATWLRNALSETGKTGKTHDVVSPAGMATAHAAMAMRNLILGGDDAT
jgi:hypothetical protein